MQISNSIYSTVQHSAAVATNDTFSSIQKDIEEREIPAPGVRHTFEEPLLQNTDQEAERIWKIIQLKSREPQFCVEVIKECIVLGEAPLGFIRQPTIEVPGARFTIKEHILLNEAAKTALFVQLDGEFLAINRIKKNETGAWVFHGTYVYGHAKEQKVFEKEMSLMAQKIFSYQLSDKPTI